MGITHNGAHFLVPSHYIPQRGYKEIHLMECYVLLSINNILFNLLTLKESLVLPKDFP